MPTEHSLPESPFSSPHFPLITILTKLGPIRSAPGKWYSSYLELYTHVK